MTAAGFTTAEIWPAAPLPRCGALLRRFGAPLRRRWPCSERDLDARNTRIYLSEAVDDLEPDTELAHLQQLVR